MPRWVLGCPHCYETFTYAEVELAGRLDEVLGVWPPKPEMPRGGVSLDCPSCKKPSTYERHQLSYSAS